MPKHTYDAAQQMAGAATARAPAARLTLIARDVRAAGYRRGSGARGVAWPARYFHPSLRARSFLLSFRLFESLRGEAARKGEGCREEGSEAREEREEAQEEEK